jgi:glucose-6-phosphate 1-dehydrogenase
LAQIQVLVIGGTGNLAQKYLWPAFYRLQLTLPLELWASGTEAVPKGKDRLREIVPDGLEVTYVQLQREEDYVALGANRRWRDGGAQADDAGQVFYVAIPPKYIGKTCRWIHTYLQKNSPHHWLRVAIEKPFGHDVASAKALAATLPFHASEVFLIDHYLGKPGLQGWRDFLALNSKWWTGLWHGNSIRHIEVRAAARTRYSDSSSKINLCEYRYL